MHCINVDDCFNEITAYFNMDVSGYPFIVNIDDDVSYKLILSKIQADSNKTIIRLSDYCKDDNLPNVDAAIAASTALGNYVLIGVSQYSMLQSEFYLKKLVSKLIQLPVNGHTVILLNGCSNLLKIFESNDIRLEHRIAILNTESVQYPKIFLAKSEEECIDVDACKGIKELIYVLENMIYSNNINAEISVITNFNVSLFKNSMYSISSVGGIYEAITRAFIDVATATDKNWGTDEQWKDFYEKLIKHKTISGVIEDEIGSTINLSYFIDERFEDIDSLDAWYLWIAMKTLGTKENGYLSLAVQKSTSTKQLLELIYMELLNHKISDPDFDKLYKERKRLIERLPEDSVLLQNYCDHIGQYEKDAVYYLTDLSIKEKSKLLLCFNSYNYTEAVILTLTKTAFPELHSYLSRFDFTEMNTQIPSNDLHLHSQLTDYFNEYKFQKVTNCIHKKFMDKVNENAVNRPFYKLFPRISIVNDIDHSNAQIHFFDALGVEYLSYIISKCEKYELHPIVHVARCELPSITSQNLEFKKYFKTVIDDNGNEVIPGTKELDKLKHHSQKIDYRKCKLPIHLFMELEIIDKELRAIREILIEQEFNKIIIISDHGASRLSVLNQSENSLYTLDGGHSEHSGRCYATDVNPKLPEAAYENGYAVLANYDRFKGGRAANVEVHGGATLEETIVPIIEIVRKPEKAEIYFVNTYIEFHNRETVAITVYSNEPILSPKIVIRELNNKSYVCNMSIDGKHYKFEIPDIKRSGTFTVDIYDGNKLISKDMVFQTKKAMTTIKNFF